MARQAADVAVVGHDGRRIHAVTEEEGVNPKDLLGIKKAPLRLVPPALVIGAAPVMALGASKYGPYNWREYPVKLSVYLEAIDRHLQAAKDGEWLDPESGQPHIFHIASCVGIIADAEAVGNLVRDWPVLPGPAARLLAAQDNAVRSETRERTVDVSSFAQEPGTEVIRWSEELVQDQNGEHWEPVARFAGAEDGTLYDQDEEPPRPDRVAGSLDPLGHEAVFTEYEASAGKVPAPEARLPLIGPEGDLRE
jgi:hypothetical protein